jgi:biopolymer transport protein ExbB/TolQ
MAGELERKVAATVDLEARVAALVAELEAQREAGGGLESELRRQRNTIAVLGREIERLERRLLVLATVGSAGTGSTRLSWSQPPTTPPSSRV